MFIGIDPSQRHTGICVLSKSLEVVSLSEIKTGDMPVLESIVYIRNEMRKVCKVYPTAVYSMEKMMPQATNGALLYCVQMAILEVLGDSTSKQLVHPLPIQLKSYMKKLLGQVPPNKTAIVEGFKAATLYKGRVSSHCADGYFLARMAEEVVNKRFKYNLSKVELPLMTWGVIDGH